MVLKNISIFYKLKIFSSKNDIFLKCSSDLDLPGQSYHKVNGHDKLRLGKMVSFLPAWTIKHYREKLNIM